MRKILYTILIVFLFSSLVSAQPGWPRFYWTQIEQADTIGALAIAGLDSTGYWTDSLRFWNGVLRIGIDTAATLADVRDNDTNFGNSNLIFNSNRSHQTGAYSLTLNTASSNNTFFMDGSNGRIGFGTNTPLYPIHVKGNNMVSDIGTSYMFVVGGTQEMFGSNTNVGYRYITSYGGTQYRANQFFSNGVLITAGTGGYPSIAHNYGYVAYIHESTKRLGVLESNPLYTLDINSSDAIRIPRGTTLEQPTGREAILRFNTTSLLYEGHNGIEHIDFATYNSSELSVGNYLFNIDQTVGAGQDDYVLTYDNSSGEIGLEATSIGVDNNGVLSASNDGGTIPTSFSIVLTDSFAIGSPTYPNLFELDSLGVLKLAIPTEDNSLVISHADTIDWSNMRGANVILGTNLSGDQSAIPGNYEGNVIIGPSTFTTGGNNNYFNTIIGANAKSEGDHPKNIVIGAYAETENIAESVAVGYAASVTGDNSIALGANSVSSSSSTTAIGAYSSASSTNAIAIGKGSVADEVGEITIGDGSNMTKLNAGNYTLNIDQAVGIAQDGYTQGYNDTSGEIELRPSAKSTHGQLTETTLTSITPTATYQRIKSLSSQNLSNFTATDSTLTYTGSEDIFAEITYTGSIFFDITTAGTYRVTLKPYVNTFTYPEAISDVQIASDGSEDWIQPISGTTFVSISNGDVISLRYTGTTGVAASLSNLSLTVKAL